MTNRGLSIAAIPGPSRAYIAQYPIEKQANGKVGERQYDPLSSLNIFPAVEPPACPTKGRCPR